MRSFFSSFVFVALAALSQPGHAQTLTLGGGVGGIGGIKSESAIAWGAHLNVNSLGWAAFHAEFVAAPFADGTLIMGSPAFAFYPVDVDGFLFGGLVGVGFYKMPQSSTQFGFNYGIIGDFSISKKFSVGMTARQHLLTGSQEADSLWNVMMTVGYKFESGGDW